MKKVSIIGFSFLMLLSILLLSRDIILGFLLPRIAARAGVELKIEKIHIGICPLALEAASVNAIWHEGEAEISGLRMPLHLGLPPSPRQISISFLRFSVVTTGEGGWHPLPLGRLKEVSLDQVDGKVSGKGWSISLDGMKVRLDMKAFTLNGGLAFSSAHGSLKGKFSFSGERGSLDEMRPRGGGELKGEAIFHHKVLPLTLALPNLSLDPQGPQIEAQNLQLKLDSLFIFKGDFSLKGRPWFLKGEAYVPSIERLSLLLPALPTGIKGALTLRGNIKRDKGLTYRFQILGKRLGIAGIGPFRLLNGEVRGVVSGEGDRGSLSVERLEVSRLIFKTPPWEERKWKGKGWLSWKRWGKGEIGAGLSLIKRGERFTVRVRSPGLSTHEVTGKAAYAGVSLRKVLTSLSRRLPFALEGAETNGRLYAHGSWSSKRGILSFQGEAKGQDLSFSTINGDGAEHLSVSLACSCPEGVGGTCNARLLLEKGEALFSSWYFNFSSNPWSLAVDVMRRDDRLCIKRVEYRGLASLSLQGLFCRGGGEGILTITGDVKPLYSQLILEPLGEKNASLREIHPQGDVKIKLHLSLKDHIRASGSVRWKGKVKAPHILIDGGLSLPVIFSPKGKGKGWLNIRSLSFNGLGLKGWKTPLLAAPYLVKTTRGMKFSLSDGEASWGPLILEYRDLEHPKLSLRDLKMRNVKYTFKGLPMQIEGDFTRLHADRERVSLDGILSVKVARGEIKVGKVWASTPGSPIRRFGCDLQFSHLDLQELTRVTTFGKISGRIKGYVKDLVITNGQPEAFQMMVETEKMKGIEQRISLSAINSISILGGGGPISVFLPFFREFPYSYIGFSCSLKNDMFTLHGLKRKDGIEYIVKRGGLIGVNVINRNPENRVSFKDMMERLKRIGRGAHEKG